MNLYIWIVQFAKQIGDFDPGAPETKMYYALKTQQYFHRSANLALDVENEFIKIGRTSREANKEVWYLGIAGNQYAKYSC